MHIVQIEQSKIKIIIVRADLAVRISSLTFGVRSGILVLQVSVKTHGVKCMTTILGRNYGEERAMSESGQAGGSGTSVPTDLQQVFQLLRRAVASVF